MKHLVSAENTPRAQAYKLWMQSPMPMVTLTKTMNINHLVRYSRRHNLKLNMLMCYCIGKAASSMEQFYLMPHKEGMMQYDSLAINVIVTNKDGGINSCDIHFTEDLQEFNRQYLALTKKAAETCMSSFLEEDMVVGTSTLVQTEIDSVINQYTELFFNPMVMWGKYRKGFLKATLPISLQYHHSQMDGTHGATFLAKLQEEIGKL
ncbi:MAG: chloramphenicol acetyltransferase [Bacteroidales bacterium]|nr:chloramphenicol acetyltransferase [Bacteroidales bacterium]